jgi:hypothetical protein
MTKRNGRPRALELESFLVGAALLLGGCAYEGLAPVDDSTAQQASTTSRFVVHGTVRDLHGSGLVLQNNGGDDIGVGADGTFAFPGLLAEGQS